MEEVKYGNTELDKELDMGPLINKEAQQSIAEKVKRAEEQDAKVMLGGSSVEGKGYFTEGARRWSLIKKKLE